MYLNTNTNTFEKYFKYFFKYLSFSGYITIYYIGKRNKTIYQAVHLVYCYCLSCLVSIWLLPSVQCSLLPSSLFPRVIHRRNISCWKVLSVRRHLSGRNTFPAMLKSLSTGAEDAGMQRKMGANFASAGYF